MISKKECKTMSNEELILALCNMQTSQYIRKSSIKSAGNICQELGNREIVDQQKLFEGWEVIYRR